MRYSICFLLLSFGVWGCSGADAPPPLYPVTGTLIVGGKPLENITVQLTPVDLDSKSKPGVGLTDAEGKFTILTNGDKGATAGKFKVVLLSSAVSKSTGPMSVEEATKLSGEYTQQIAQGKRPEPPALPFPKEWADATTTPKEVEVVNQPVIIKIDI
jgi:hypothetical protein